MPVNVLSDGRSEAMLIMDSNEDSTVYMVVVNDEEQYSIWPAHRSLPTGWRSEGVKGTKQACLDHIRDVWTDMRPLSLRRAMGVAHVASR